LVHAYRMAETDVWQRFARKLPSSALLISFGIGLIVLSAIIFLVLSFHSAPSTPKVGSPPSETTAPSQTAQPTPTKTEFPGGIGETPTLSPTAQPTPWTPAQPTPSATPQPTPSATAAPPSSWAPPVSGGWSSPTTVIAVLGALAGLITAVTGLLKVLLLRRAP
jgi:hypothetical protein